jgi:3-hydroxyacyl-CoA dehydrogenase
LIGVRTCASVSALSLEAQPAELDSEVRRICFPSGTFSLMDIIILDFYLIVYAKATILRIFLFIIRETSVKNVENLLDDLSPARL